MSSKRIVLNVGGKRFHTLNSTLQSIPDTLLFQLNESHPSYDSLSREYFFDRNPEFFGSILDYYRSGELHFSHCLCGPAIKKELKFWGIDEHCISSCCWRAYTAFEDMKNTLEELDKTLNEAPNHIPDDQGSNCGEISSRTNDTRMQRLRRIVWCFLDKPQSSQVAQVGKHRLLKFPITIP